MFPWFHLFNCTIKLSKWLKLKAELLLITMMCRTSRQKKKKAKKHFIYKDMYQCSLFEIPNLDECHWFSDRGEQHCCNLVRNFFSLRTGLKGTWGVTAVDAALDKHFLAISGLLESNSKAMIKGRNNMNISFLKATFLSKNQKKKKHD